MKFKALFITACALILAGLVFIVAGFHGDLGVNLGSSMESNAFHLCGASTGWIALTGLSSILVGLLVLLITLVVLVMERLKT